MRLRLLFLPALFFAAALHAQTLPINWVKKNGPLGGEVIEIEVDPSTNKVFLLDGDGNAFVSNDGTVSWTKVDLGNNSSPYFRDIEITNNTIFLVGNYDLYASTDGGVQFVKRMSDTNPYSNGERLKRMPSSGNLVVLSYNSIYLSTDNGVTWTPKGALSGVDQGYHMEVTELDQIIILKQNASFEVRPFRSSNSGDSFTEVSTGIPSGHHVNSLSAQNDRKKVFCTTSTDVFSSVDGSSWTSLKNGSITETIISDVHPGNSYVEFSADGLGMFFIDNVNHKLHSKTLAETTWALRQADFPSGTLQALCASAKDYAAPTTSTVFFGSHSGVFKTITGGASTSQPNTGLAAVKARQMLSDRYGYLYLRTNLSTTTSYGLLRSNDDGNSWSNLTGLGNPIDYLTNNSEAIFGLVATTLYRSYNNGTDWSALSPPSGGFSWVGAVGDNKVFGLASTGNPLSLYYSVNNGETWTATPVTVTGLPATFSIYPESISFASPNRMFLSLFSSGNLYYRIDFTYNASGAITAAAATQITTLPIPLTDVFKTAAANGRIFVYQAYGASSDRIAMSSDGGVSWTTTFVPSSDNMFVLKNGYVFLSDGSGDKLYISRDHGITFEETVLPANVNLYDLQDLVLDYRGFAYLAFDGDYLYQSENTIVLPTAPTTMQVTGKSATSVSLGWIETNEYDVDIIIERSTNGTDFTAVGQVRGGRWERCLGDIGYFIDTDLTANTQYTYRVRGKNRAGISGATATVVVTTLGVCAQTLPSNRSWSAINSGTEDYTLLGTPVNVGIKHLGGGKYEISDLSLSLPGFVVASTFYESCGQTLVGETNTLVPNGNSTWDGTTLKLKWRKCSTGETETILLTLNANDPAPAAPQALYAYVVSNTAIELKWPTGFYEKTYVLERSLNELTGFSQIATIDYPQTTYVDNGPLVEGVTYYYRIKGLNGNVSPLQSTYSPVAIVPFKKPNFLVADNAITNYNEAATLGSLWADFNNDGNEDYLTMKLDNLNQVAKPVIIKNLGGGNFEPVVVDVGDAPHFFPSVVDFDNDGFMDLVLNGSEVRLLEIFKGNGDFTFTKIPSGQLGELAVVQKRTSATSWADVDGDGLPDLLLLNDEDGSFTLYKQNANHTFSKIVQGPATTDEQPILSIWSDYDNDGDQDVLIGGQNGLQQNNGTGQLTKVTGAGIEPTEFLAAAWGDYDNDGNVDLFVGVPAKNLLYKNNGNGTFTKVDNTSISEANFTISAAWGDYNNDGYLDLMTVSFGGQASRLFLRDPSVTSTVTFKKIVTEKINDVSVSHYSVANADPDQNGQLDLSLSAFIFDDLNNDDLLPTNNNFYRNNNTLANWCEVKLKPSTGSTEALGARIKLITTGMIQVREIRSGSSLASRNSQIAHFGLGSASSITNIEVTWPSGLVQNYANPPINQLIIIEEDFDAPSIVGFSAPPSTPKGQNLTLPMNVTDNIAVNSVRVFARKITVGDFVEIAATKGSGDTWNAVLDQTIHFDAIGTEYYIEARDNAANMTRSPVGTGTHKTYLKYSETDASIPSARLSFGGQMSDWRIIAVPFELGSSGTVSAVFNEFAGLTDKVDYRIITYQNQTSWLDLSGTSTLQRSKGYFINIKNTIADIGVGTDLVAPANTRSDLETINLNQGWNMIGNPYLTQISWSDVAALNGLTGPAAELKKYNGAGYSVQTQLLEPYEGAFVFVNNAIPDVIIPFKGQTSVGGRTKGFAAFDTDISKDTWGLKLHVTQGKFNYELGSIGMAPDANPSFDDYDDVTPPRLFDYLEMNFSHPEHHARRFTRDIVPTQENFTWNFTVDSNLEGMAEITWDNIPLVSSGKDIFLLDITTQKLVNMKSTASHAFDPKESSHFRIYYGDNLNIAPERVQLGKAYPNPTKGLTTIAFSLPETGGLNQNVTLDIVDALGRTVGTLKNGVFNPGYHEAAFDATEMNNGFYTYRLTVRNRKGHTTEVNKLIIK